MRLPVTTLVLLFVLASALTATRVANASAIDEVRASAPTTYQQQEVDDNDDTRVEVQFVVLGIAAGIVFVLGSGAYLLRKKLGLVAPPPDQSGDGHH